MTANSRQAYDEWKQADARARLAEARLAEAWDAYFGRRGGPPAAQLIQEVSQLRAVANDRLTATMLTLSSRPRFEDSDPGPSSH